MLSSRRATMCWPRPLANGTQMCALYAQDGPQREGASALNGTQLSAALRRPPAPGWRRRGEGAGWGGTFALERFSQRTGAETKGKGELFKLFRPSATVRATFTSRPSPYATREHPCVSNAAARPTTLALIIHNVLGHVPVRSRLNSLHGVGFATYCRPLTSGFEKYC